MINRYNDLAANERTYLAWMRTALALIAFGFVLERFDLLLKTFLKSLNNDQQLHLSPLGREAGMAMIVLGLLLMLLSTLRFIVTTRLIRSERTEDYGIRSVLILGSIFILLGNFILLYVNRVISGI